MASEPAVADAPPAATSTAPAVAGAGARPPLRTVRFWQPWAVAMASATPTVTVTKTIRRCRSRCCREAVPPGRPGRGVAGRLPEGLRPAGVWGAPEARAPPVTRAPGVAGCAADARDPAGVRWG